MGLFDKKECAVCGKKVGIIGARKVEDGTICSDCAKKLSPFFNERKRSSVSEIKEQLAYREENMKKLQHFNPTRTLGDYMKVYIDDNQRKFVISSKRNFRDDNPDIIDFSQVRSVRTDIDECRNEIYDRNSGGERVSYNPPRYEYKYSVSVYISVDSPYFNEIKVDLTGSHYDRNSAEYRRAETAANEIASAFNMGNMQGAYGGGQPYIQQNYQQGYARQDYQQAFNQQGQYAQNPYGQAPQNMYSSEFWQCPNCGMTNSGAYCTSCGAPR